MENTTLEHLPQDLENVLPDTTELNKTVSVGKPFNTIGLALSGGGFRASSFSLGCLSYLNHAYLKDEKDLLLDHVEFITSTSGGSITNAYYTASVHQENFNFRQFYDRMKQVMNGDALVSEVFKILKDKKAWTEEGTLTEDGKQQKVHKSKNLINSFAKAYDHQMFNGQTLGIVNTPHSRLKDVCFNATEFNNGISFRFQMGTTKAKYGTNTGNYYLKFKTEDVSSRLKLSDIVATSSCFPIGFEPMIYPNDYIHSGLSDVNEMKEALDYKNNDPLTIDAIKNKPFCLMDGGIVDNMGVYSMMVQDDLRAATGQDRFDLILACDVSSYFLDPLVPTVTPETWWLKMASLNRVLNLSGFFILVFLLSLVSIFLPYCPLAGYLLLLPSLLLSLPFIIAKAKLMKAKKENTTSWGKMIFKFIDYLFDLRLNIVDQMLLARAGSGVKLASDLFLKQIRRTQYEQLYSQPLFLKRAISCLIYEFSDANKQRRLSNLNTRDKAWWQAMATVLMPSDKMIEVTNAARNMATTLWFDDADTKNNTRDKIIATGQFTMCYSLIKHICRLEIQDPGYKTDATIQALKARLLSDWAQFQANPMYMV